MTRTTIRGLSGASRTAPLAMVVGPTRQPESVRRCMSLSAPPLTDPHFIAEFGRCLARLRELLGAERTRTVVVPGSGTQGLESVVVSLVRPGESVLVASTGMWGDRWRDICLRNGIRAQAPRFPAGRAPDLHLIDGMLARGDHRALLVVHVDSSSGVRADLHGLGRVARARGVPLFVDGVSAIGAEQVEVDAWGVDVYLAGPPKGLAGPAGVATYARSERVVDRLQNRAWQPHSYSLDLAPWLPVMAATERGDFGYFQSTAGNLVLGLSEALRLALDEGRGARVARHARLRDVLHAGFDDLGVSLLVPDRRDRANGVTVGVVPRGMDEPDFLHAVASHGVLLQAGTLPATRHRTFRVGHLGTVDEADVQQTLVAVRAALTPGGAA